MTGKENVMAKKTSDKKETVQKEAGKKNEASQPAGGVRAAGRGYE